MTGGDRPRPASSGRDLWRPVGTGRDLRMPVLGLAAWVGGLVGLLAVPRVAPVVVVLVTCALGMLAVLLVRSPAARRTVAAALLVAMAVGACAALRDAAVRDGPVARMSAERVAVTATLTITSDPRRSKGSFGTSVRVRAVVRVLRPENRMAPAGGYRVHSPVLVIGDASWLRVRLGSTHVVRARLAPAADHDLAAVLTPFGPPAEAAPPSLGWRASARVRHGVSDSVSGRQAPARSLVPALVDGDDQDLPEDVQEEFRTSGLTHLLAVSGTNLTLVVGALLVVGRWCGVRGRWQYLLGAVGVVGFVLLARTEPSVVRAAAMGTVALLGMGSGGRDRGTRALGVAVVCLLLWDPWLATRVGFALSVLATAGILFLAPGWAAAMSRWMPLWLAQAIAVPAAAQLACTPVVAAISGQVSLVAVLANMAAAPLVAPATVLGLLGGVLSAVWVPLGRLPGWAAVWCAHGIISIADRSSRMALPALDWGTDPWSLGLLVVGCAWLAVGLGPVLARRGTGVACGVLMVVLVVVPLPTPGWPPEGWVVAACSVGQGDALVLAAGNNRAVVVDAGPDPDLVDRCLDRLDVESVPLLVLSHFHADHVDGVPGVLEGRPVGEVLVAPLPEPADRFAATRRLLGDRMRVPEYGEVLAVGDVRLQVLGPLPGAPNLEPNNASLVVLAEVRGVRILLTGDVEPEAQRRLAAGLADLRIDVLKVPHHGSRHQDLDFLTGLRPTVALTSVGEDNDYGHPAAATLDPLRAAGAAVFRTDRDGDVVVVPAGSSGGGVDLRVRTSD